MRPQGRPAFVAVSARLSPHAMKAAEIREKFLKFFESKGHTIVRSSSLVPGNDPTLMFTNSGMVQFKDVFLGTDRRPYSRATTAQRSVRAGGKHNDLENVGYTARHHTFFEMLGNFSFGDYFKQDAIKFAWELLTTVYLLPKDKLWVTVYQEDDEAYDIWAKEVGVATERIIRIGDNKGARYAVGQLLDDGDTGPCGPCTEIFYDHGPDVWGGPPGSHEEDGDRYIEIWNLVFMQFNRDAQGNMTRLPKPCVDTGMGLERLAAVLQHVHSNYEIDLFQNLIKAAARVTEVADLNNNSLKVIADHIRACAFLIVDGVIPGNEGRGYVLRRIVRRAIRHGYKLGRKGSFFHKLVADLVAEMGDAYPELKEAEQRVTDVLRQEEERFFETIEHGMSILEAALAELDAKGGKVLDGELAFKLHDTYGFPLDLTADVCRERSVTVDEPAFDDAMARQREQARAAGKFKATQGLEYTGAKTTFHGYEEIAFDDAKVVALYVDGSSVNEVKTGQHAVVVLDHTPFYAESGGQVGDQGVLANAATRFAVADTLKVQADVIGHHGTLEQGTLKIGDVLRAEIDAQRRARTQRNHSATHLMHKALREVLGSHVQQKGSLVDADKTRFDFAHNAPLTDDEIRRVEQIVNDEILANAPGIVRVMPYDEAVKGGAMAAVRRQVRRRSARARPRVLARTVRRHAREPHRRHRAFQDRDGRRRRGRHPPRRGDHRRQRGALRAGTRRTRAGSGGRAEGAAVGAHAAHRASAGSGEVAREGAVGAEVEARVEPGRRARATGGRRRRRAGAGRDARRRGREDAARDGRQAEGQAEARGDRAGGRRRRQGQPDRRRDAGREQEGEGRRAGELRRAAGRRQGRRPSGHGAGRRHRAGEPAGRARGRQGLGRSAARLTARRVTRERHAFERRAIR
ncbi:Alanyl-tRNA synthetase [Burkholderia dolosa AU0158]|nr:Alanyl-tRNA synthetase [Burkholderia dolosa AU0158]